MTTPSCRILARLGSFRSLSRADPRRVFPRECYVRALDAHDELDGEDVLPGFRCPLNEIVQ